MVESVETAGAFHLVSARIAPGAPPLVVEVTADALAELEIGPGTELYLLLKTSAITVYEDASAEEPGDYPAIRLPGGHSTGG